MGNQMWWNGPKFLKLLRDHWPRSPQTKTLLDKEDVLQEMVKHPCKCNAFSGHNKVRLPVS